MHTPSVNEETVIKTRPTLTPSLQATRSILKDPLTFLADLTTKYDDIVPVKFLGKKYIILQHPDSIKHVLLDNHKKYFKPGATKLLSFFLGEGLSTSNGELWLRQRRIMQPAFHKQRLQKMVGHINEEITAFESKLRCVEVNSEINLTHYFLELTIRIISRAMFSSNLSYEMKRMVGALESLAGYAFVWMKSIVKVPLNWPTPANVCFRRDCRVFDEIIYNIIAKRKMDRAKGVLYDDLLDMLLDYENEEKQEGMNLKQLKDEITTMFMAGHETTAQTMSWLFYHLAGDDQIYRQVKAEGAKMLQGELAGLEDLRQLTFTTQVISEALRKYPPIWAIVRKPFIDDQMNGISIPSSTNVLINLYGMHLHPAYWQTPHQFNPAHFDLSKKQQPPPYVYLPFGGGPRICIGSNFAMTVMQLVLSRLTQTIQFNIPKNYAPAVEPNITLRAKGGIRLIINHNAV